jgi:hypothetical protein
MSCASSARWFVHSFMLHLADVRRTTRGATWCTDDRAARATSRHG